MIKRITIAALAVTMMVGCQKESNSVESVTSTLVEFSAKSVATRVTQIEEDGEMVYAWESDDRVGIFTNGFDLADYSNVEYAATTATTSTSTAFEAVSSPIEIDGSFSGDLEFYAYYPYSEDIITDGYSLDVSKQFDDPDALNFFVASSSIEVSEGVSGEQVAFEFNHILSQVVFNVTFGEDVDDVSSLKVLMSGVDLVQTYDCYGDLMGEYVENSEDIEPLAEIAADGRSAVVTVTLHPFSDFSSEIKFNVDGDIYNYSFSAELEKGMQYIYDVPLE